MFDPARIKALQDDLFPEIDAQIASDGHHKSYEGSFEVVCCWPNRFEYRHDPESRPTWFIKLHCYVVGPSRHYGWEGKTFDEAMRRCERDVRRWIEESIAFRHCDDEIGADMADEAIHGAPPEDEVPY